MFGGGGQVFEKTVRAIEAWIPEKKYRSESKFQNDLQEFLDSELNSGGGLLGGGGSSHQVGRERGSSRVDVSVDDVVGIEIKRNLSNSQVDRLIGQIDKQRDEFDYLVVVACGINDMDGWRRLENKFGSKEGLGIGGGLGMDQKAPVELIYKKKENFGKDPSEFGQDQGLFGRGDDLFGGDSLL